MTRIQTANQKKYILKYNFIISGSIIILILIFGFLLNGYSQATTNPQTNLPNVFPVNPKASEFVKYTEVPVGKYTGVPSIGIPIYNIKANGIEMPVSLSYHSNGFRVNEEAGWTGLGWSLNAGGSIVQVVNGFDDFGWDRQRDNEFQGMVTTTNVPSNELGNGQAIDFGLVLGNLTLPLPGDGLSRGGNSATFPVGPIYQFFSNHNLLEGHKDSKIDVFKFNMLGYSGEFVLDWRNETFKCISDRDIKIEAPNYTNNPSSGETQPNNFTIITPDGSRFLFTLKEATINSGLSYYATQAYPYQPNFIGSKSSRVYQLISIYTKGGDLISFNYVQTPELENLPAISLSFTYEDGAPGVYPIPYTNYPTSTSVNYSRQSLSYLESIEFPTGKLIFNSSNDRIDFIGMRKLNSIDLKDPNNATVKSFNFTYDYFVGHTSGNNTDNYLSSQSPPYNTGKIASELTHRLKLLSVKESGIPAYLFEYNEELLPKKTSLAVDNWGLYNGKLSNVDLMPNISMTGLKDPSLIGINNNKNSNLTGSKAAVLKKITYPTGGISGFDYELNSFVNFRVPDDEHATVSSVFLNDRNNPGDNPAQIFSSDVQSILYAGTYNISTFGPMSPYTTDMSAYIRLTVLKKTPANITLTNSPTTFWPLYYTTPLGQLPNYINDVVSDTRILKFDFIQATQQYETFKLAENQVIHIDPDNIYIIQAYLDNSFGAQSNSSQGANASVYLTFLKNTGHPISYGAGLRIKTIRTEDTKSPPIIKSYEYSGGKLMSPMLYMVNSKTYYFDYGPPVLGYVGPINKTQINSSSFMPPSTNASGKYVGYDIVSDMNSTIDPNNQTLINPQGKVVDYYMNNPDRGSLNSLGLPDPASFSGTEIVMPFATPRGNLNYIAPLQKANLQNGLTTRSRIYDNSQTLLQETVNDYSFVMAADDIYNRVSCLKLRTSPEPVSQNILNMHLVGFYPITSTKTFIQTSHNYVYSGNNVLHSIQNYFYDNHNQLSYTTITDSKQNTRKSTFKYPYDFSEYATMANTVKTPVVEKTDELIIGSGTNPISKTKNTFLGFTSISGAGVWDITAISSSKGTGALEEELSYDLFGNYNYPEKHKPLQYHDKSGVTTSIVWGYNGQYPVAKIIGKPYYDVISQSGINLSVVNNTLTSDATMRTELNKIRQLSNCYVTTFTHKPLIGVSSETDPNGKTTYYEYDAVNRLSLIRDQDNNILKKICYNYAGQPENCNPCTNNTPNWQNTTDLRCQKGSCGNTGYQEQKQKDMNPCSPSFDSSRWIIAGYNPSACPIGNCVNLTSTNTYNTQGYVASYYNTATTITYTFNVSTASGLQSLGTVPSGNYTLTISRPVLGNIYSTFKSGCFKQTIAGNLAVFSNVVVSTSTCNSITTTVNMEF